MPASGYTVGPVHHTGRHTGRQKTTDQAQQATIRNMGLQPLHQAVMIDPVEEGCQVQRGALDARSPLDA